MNLPALNYEDAKSLIQNPDPEIRWRVAGDTAAPPEALFYLAEDSDPGVRMAVAQNPVTPRLANMVLAKDADYNIRCALARKLVGDGLSAEQRDDFWRLGFTVLEALATDQVVRVRQILVNGLKLFADAPRSVVLALCRDSEPDVAAPMLESSPVLEDDDILDLVQEVPDWAQEAVARRQEVSPRVAKAIVEHGAPSAVAELAANDGAEIPEAALDAIVERADGDEALQQSLARRRKMPGRFLVKLAKMAAAPLLSVIRRRDDIDAETGVSLDGIARDRDGESREAGPDSPEPRPGPAAKGKPRPVAENPGENPGDTPASPPPPALDAAPGETATEYAIRLHKEGGLDDDMVAAALDDGETDFVVTALALRARVGRATVRAILDSRSPKAVTALCWRGGFKMRFAVDIQRRVAKVEPARLLYARGGVSFPLTQEEMTAQLEFFLD